MELLSRMDNFLNVNKYSYMKIGQIWSLQMMVYPSIGIFSERYDS